MSGRHPQIGYSRPTVLSRSAIARNSEQETRNSEDGTRNHVKRDKESAPLFGLDTLRTRNRTSRA
jgi:hypothetical protein